MDSNDHQISPQLDQLLQQHNKSSTNKLWRGTHTLQAPKASNNILDTGHTELNKHLHNGGWPLVTTTEFGLSLAGIGELRLLAPALRNLLKSNHSQQNILFIAPPFLPFAPAFTKHQIDVNKLTIVQTNNIYESLWATEQALLAECCAAVFSWTGDYNLNARQLRRLQLAAEKTNTWNVLFRHSDCLKQSSPSGLRLHLQINAYSKLDIHILKQPQGWGGQRCTLSLDPHYENWQRLPAHLLPAHNQLKPPMHQPKPLHDPTIDHQPASVTILCPITALKTVH